MADGLGETVFVASSSRSFERFTERDYLELKNRLGLKDFSIQFGKVES
jgi:hypothetical protein